MQRLQKVQRKEEVMSEVGAVKAEIDEFLAGWEGDEQPMRNRFEAMYKQLAAMDNVELQFVARAGVSYSIRPKHANQQERDLFAIVDVIDDDPAERWLSVCFYGDMITDPEDRGELIPGGLAGSDGYCFDMFDDDESMASYLRDRLDEAAGSAASS